MQKIKALADARDWVIVETYDDPAVSATKKRRAGTRWAEMLDDARAGRFSMVVAVDMDRLLRSTKDLNTLIDLGLRVVTVDGEIDLSTADGEFRATMLAALARFEARARLSARSGRTSADAQKVSPRRPGRHSVGRRTAR